MSKRLVVTMIDAVDPWKVLEPPAQAYAASGRRVDPELQWNLYWGLDADRSCLLMFRYARENSPRNKLPSLRGLDVEMRRLPDSRDALLVVRLKEPEQRAIFHRLCLDISSATREAESEADAVQRFLARTWRWHRLLRTGHDGRLSTEEQKGLIGELQFLEYHLMPVLGVQKALHAWVGPLDAPKDFEIGDVCVECKARRGGAQPWLSISSEFQLDDDGLSALFVHVASINTTTMDDEGRTLTDIVKAVGTNIEIEDPGAEQLFNERLSAAGFDWSHDYSDSLWQSGSEQLYEVQGQFPRVRSAALVPGVSKLKYAISLHACEGYRVDAEYVRAMIEGNRDGVEH